MTTDNSMSHKCENNKHNQKPVPEHYPADPQEALNLALQHHQEGRLKEAGSIYKDILKAHPRNSDALHFLGLMEGQLGRHESSVMLINKAIQIDPSRAEFHRNLGVTFKAMGKFEDAIESYRRAIAINPDFTEAHSNLGVAFQAIGKFENAVASYQRAIAINPNQAETHNNLGVAFQAIGKLEDAIASYRQAIAINRNYPEPHSNLGNVFKTKGKYDDAIESYHRAIAINPNYPMAHNNLGSVLEIQGKPDDAIASYQQAIAINHDFPDAHYNIGNVLRSQGKFTAAIEKYRMALQVKPDHTKAMDNMRFLFKKVIPSWHFGMMNDSRRNNAYNRAIKKIVKKDSLILDIGTGSGLLSLMAARAGAVQVITSEMIPLIAEKAEEIIRLNGFERTISVLNKKSTSLKIGTDIPDRADILISEIFDAGLLGEEAVPVIQHARAHLLKPDAKVIPKRATVFAILVESQQLFEDCHIEMASDFDLSPFNEFQPRHIQERIQSFSHRFISDAFEVFSFDFCGDLIREEQKEIKVNPSTNGTCHAIVIWFHLHLDDEIIIDTGPQNRKTCWMQLIQLLSQPVKIKRNDIVTVSAKHDTTLISMKIKGDYSGI